MEPSRPRDDDPEVLVVAHSHLDVQWRWTVVDTVARFLPKTVDQVAAQAARFPRFVISIDGVFRLALVKAHDPERFETLRGLVASGSWHVAGPLWEATDCILPSPESLIRQVQVGQHFLDRELGVEPLHVFVPDCFGFPLSLPSILAHCGLTGFLTQKLRRGPLLRAVEPVPFPVGWWEGPDGARVLAVLDTGGYGTELEGPVQALPEVAARLEHQQRVAGSRPGGGRVVQLVGVGDTGGAPEAATLEHLFASVDSGEAPRVAHLASQTAFDRLAAEPGLATWRDELLLSLHATGCYTSKVTMKRWNRLGERLARAAEAAALGVAAAGLAPWPESQLATAWERLLWHQFHDDLTGTSVPEAYRISIHDEAAAASLFAGVLRSSVERLAARLDTRGPGQPFVVWNDVPRQREELVELVVDADSVPREPVVVDGDGRRTACQIARRDDGSVELLARVAVGGFGLAVVWLAEGTPDSQPGRLEASATYLASEGLVLELDRRLEVASLVDAAVGELLREPIGYELFRHHSPRFPAWEIHRRSLARPTSRLRAAGPARVIESGPLRGTLAVRRRAYGVELEERLSLEAGAATVRSRLAVDWRARARLMKVAFPLACRPPEALFDAGWGVARRSPTTERRWEVPAHEWAAVAELGLGAAIASPHRHGWDQPESGLLRLTLVHSPRTGLGRRFRHQGRLDHGSWSVDWHLRGTGGADSTATIAAWAEERARPLRAFRTSSHGGELGHRLSLLEAPPDLAVLALGRDEGSRRAVVRVVDRAGLAGGRRLESPLVVGGNPDDAVRVDRIDGRGRPWRGAASTSTAPGRLDLELEGWGGRTLAFGGSIGDLAPRGRGLELEALQPLEWARAEVEALASEGIGFRLVGVGGSLAGCQQLVVGEERGRLHLLVIADEESALEVRSPGGGTRALRIPSSLAPLAVESRAPRWGRRGEVAAVERTAVAALIPRIDADGRPLPYAFATIFHLRLDLSAPVELIARAGVLVLAATLEDEPPPAVEACDPLVERELGRSRSGPGGD